MALNISSDLTAEQQLQLVYTGYYGRAAEPQGFDFWLGLLQADLNGDPGGWSLSEIATEFFDQPETRAVYDLADDVTTTADLPSAAGFLLNVYENLFDRVPDPVGLEFWSGVLDEGNVPIGEIILSIAGGAQGGRHQRAAEQDRRRPRLEKRRRDRGRGRGRPRPRCQRSQL